MGGPAGADLMLVCDLDGTLLGDDEALRRFSQWYKPPRNRIRLVYASGRFFDDVVELVRTTALPAPDAVIGAVGTEIRRFDGGEPVPGWREELSANWSAGGVRQALESFPRLELQPERWQSDLKVSYYLDDAAPGELDALRDRLEQRGLGVRIIYSSDRDLDVLPAGAGKGPAAAFLARQWGISPRDCLAAGDSGNDRDMFEQGFRGVVVANAQPELQELSGPNIYHARQSSAAGVLEGIDYWWRNDEPD